MKKKLVAVQYMLPRIVTVSTELLRQNPSTQRSLRATVARSMGEPDGSISSRSGMTAALAIEWCESRGVSYTVKASPGLGYFVARDRSAK